MTALPAYVVNGNLYDSLDPVQLTNVVMHCFCVPGDEAKIQAWLDRTFAAPSGGAVRYTALGGRLFLGIAQIGRLHALNEGKPPKGYTSEIDLTVWILAHRVDGGFSALRWIPAYLFVDSGPVLATGREVWGFPKQLGRFGFTAQGQPGGGSQTFEAEGWVVSPFGPDSPARWATMFEVRPVARPAAPRKGDFLASLEELGSRLAERLTGGALEAAGAVQTAIGAGTMTMAFLKQFPDAAQPHLACYQAVVEAVARVTKLRGSGLTNDHYEARITSFDTHPYLEELGISSDWQPVGEGVWMDFDFQQALGSAVWRSGI